MSGYHFTCVADGSSRELPGYQGREICGHKMDPVPSAVMGREGMEAREAESRRGIGNFEILAKVMKALTPFHIVLLGVGINI